MARAADPSALLRRTLGGGALAGLIAGLVVGVVALAGTLRSGDPWPVLKLAGAPFYGGRAFAPGYDTGPVLVGVSLHLVLSVGWGALFGMLFYGLTRAATVVTGLLWGLVVWLSMFYVVLPLAGLWRLVEETPRGPVIVQHLLFGLVAALAFLPFQSSIRIESIAKSQRFYGPLEH